VDKDFICAVRAWLRENIPEFADFLIQSAGKYLGWYLGRNSAALSFAEPIAKYNKRVLDIADAKAPSTVAFLKYNERAITVLSYVAQFAYPPPEFDIDCKEFQAVHKLLRMPPQSMSYELSHRLEDFCIVAPVVAQDYCLAIMFRFAYSERKYLADLAVKIQGLIGNSMTLEALDRLVIPDGGLRSPPILQSLFNALEMSGNHACLHAAFASSPEDSDWFNFPTVVSSYNFGIKRILLPEVAPPKLQSNLMKIFKDSRNSVELGPILAAKAVTTLSREVAVTISMSSDWYNNLLEVFQDCKVLLRMSWLKAITGGWTTTIRMHELYKWPCIFGCNDSRDEFNHYLLCPVLWQLVREQIGTEEALTREERLCLQRPSRQKLRHLALCHFTYHSCKNDSVISSLMNNFCRHNAYSSSSSSSGSSSSASTSSSSSESLDVEIPWRTVQDRAVGYCRAGVSIIGPP